MIFLGDGVPVNEKIIREEMTVSFSFAPAQANRQRGASVAALGSVYFAEGKTVSAMDHAPDYLRKAQAERELEEAKRQGRRTSWQQDTASEQETHSDPPHGGTGYSGVAELESICFSESWSCPHTGIRDPQSV